MVSTLNLRHLCSIGLVALLGCDKWKSLGDVETDTESDSGSESGDPEDTETSDTGNDEGSTGETPEGPSCEGSISTDDYDRTCTEDLDCVNVFEGAFAQGCLECAGGAINVAALEAYDAAMPNVDCSELACDCIRFHGTPARCEDQRCEPSSTDSTSCEGIAGSRFESVELLECGEAPEGEAAECYWTIEFEADGTFLWMHSDVGESGVWTCDGGQLTNDVGVEASFDSETQILTWGGVQYVPQDGA